MCFTSSLFIRKRSRGQSIVSINPWLDWEKVVPRGQCFAERSQKHKTRRASNQEPTLTSTQCTNPSTMQHVRGIIPPSTPSRIRTSQNHTITSTCHNYHESQGNYATTQEHHRTLDVEELSFYILVDGDTTSEKEKSYSPSPLQFTPFSPAESNVFTHLGIAG